MIITNSKLRIVSKQVCRCKKECLNLSRNLFCIKRSATGDIIKANLIMQFFPFWREIVETYFINHKFSIWNKQTNLATSIDIFYHFCWKYCEYDKSLEFLFVYLLEIKNNGNLAFLIDIIIKIILLVLYRELFF